jgi:hypothetical protein
MVCIGCWTFCSYRSISSIFWLKKNNMNLSLLKNKVYLSISIIEFGVGLLFLLKFMNLINLDFILINFPNPLIIICLCSIKKYFIIVKDKKLKILSYVIILFLILSIINNYCYLDFKIMNNLINAILGSISLLILIFFEYKEYKYCRKLGNVSLYKIIR